MEILVLVYTEHSKHTMVHHYRVWFNETIYPDRIERFNKARGSNNSGSSWSQDKYVWKTTDYGATWKKCNVYRSTNSGSTWSKV